MKPLFGLLFCMKGFRSGATFPRKLKGGILMSKRKNRVFVDMDGTLAKWQWGGDWQSPHYYLNLPAMKQMVKAIKKLQEEGLVDIEVLSCAYCKEAVEDKKKWLKKNLPGIKATFVPYGENKGDYVNVSPRDVLVDDYSPNLHKWEGRTVKVLNGVNGTKGTYKGVSVNAGWDADVIAETILTVAETNFEVVA